MSLESGHTKNLVLLLALFGFILIVYVSICPFKPVQAICAPFQGINSMITKASGNNLYVLWESSDGYPNNANVGNHTLFFKKSSDGSKTFGPSIILDTTAQYICSTFFSHMVVGGDGKGKNNVYVLWNDGGILIRASSDGGASFGNTISLGNGSIGIDLGPALMDWGAQIWTGGLR